MDPGTVLALIGGYLAVATAVFLLYSPLLIPMLGLLLAAGILQLLAWPFIFQMPKIGRDPPPPPDGSWLLH